MIQCQDCISFAICLANINFEKQPHNSYGYFMNLSSISNKCDLVQYTVTSESSWDKFKIFFLKQKGLV
jgi:hypothetical protein